MNNLLDGIREANQTVTDVPAVSVIIVNWNRKALLATCLTSLKQRTTYPNYHVIVVDNGSVDGSTGFLKEQFPWIDIVALRQNYGFAVGNNEGITYALEKYFPKYFLLLNNDTEIIQDDWLNKMVRLAESEADVGIVGCKLIYPDGKTQHVGTKVTVAGGAGLLIPARLSEVYEVDAVLGACFLVKREVIRKIGVLDVGFSPFNDEETDFCMRAKKARYKTLLISSVNIVHFKGSTIGKVDSAYVRFVRRRNAIRFMLLNFPASWLVKRMPFEILVFVLCFITKNKGANKFLPLTLRKGADMVTEVQINVTGWLYNLGNLREIAVKRQNRTMKLTCQSVRAT